MNRITVDKEINSINENFNYLINKHKKNYVFNVHNSDVNILSIKESVNEESYEINIDGGKVIFNNVSYSSKDINITVNLNKKKSEIVIYNSIISNDDIKVKIRINHNSKNTVSNVYNNGVTKKEGTINFDVTSYVPKNVKGCIVNQDSKIISLNDKNNNEINPILLIDEYDTSARHAAFIGKFNEQELFYLMSRGLDKKTSEKLLLNGLLIGTLEICFEEKEMLKEKFENDWR